MSATPSRARWWIEAALVAAVLYVGVAHFAFAIRHPWMTSTERLLWTGAALTWSTVTVEQVR